MSHQLINLNSDLHRLLDGGYEIRIKEGFIFVYHIPYLDSNLELKHGVLACSLAMAGDVVLQPPDHTALFCGQRPYNIHGKEVHGLVHSDVDNPLPDGTRANLYLSAKPKSGNYANYYDKITAYIRLFSSNATEIFPHATAQTYVSASVDEDDAFVYNDTNTSKANIYAVSNKLRHQKIAIIGIGGTGSYILDFIAKTPVTEIHIFDGDEFLSHNAFRSPSAPSIDTLRTRIKKVDYFADIYQNMRKKIHAHDYPVTEENVHELLNFDFVFVAIDSGSSRRNIVNYLVKQKRPFIDVGIGVTLNGDALLGQIRTTLGQAEDYDHLEQRLSYADRDDDDYSSNIQIAELNALNATFAVIQWKRLCGFYLDIGGIHNTNYALYNGGISNAFREEEETAD